MRKNLSVIYFAPSNFGAIDAVLPVLSEIRRRHGNDVTIDCVYWGIDAEGRLSPSEFHTRMLAECTTEHRLVLSNRFPRLIQRLYRLFYVLLLVIFRQIMHRRCIIISSTFPKNAAERGLSQFLQFMFGSRYFLFPSLQAPINEKLANRFSESGMALRDKFREQIFRRERYQSWLPSNRICYLPSEIDLIRNNQQWNDLNQTPKTFIAIGLPRLFSGWQRDLETIGVPVIEKEMRRLGLPEDSADLIVVVLTIPDKDSKHWFEYAGQFYDLLDDLIESIRKKHPENPIILKEKPVGVPIYEDLKERYAGKRVFLSNCALSVLGLRAKLAFSIQESSGLLDLAMNGVPAIEYARYNDEWLVAWPWGSANVGEPGIEVALSRERLDELIAMVADGTFPTMNHQQIAQQLGHTDNLDALIGPRP